MRKSVFGVSLLLLPCSFLVADDVEQAGQSFLSGDWGGRRTAWSKKGIDFGFSLALDDTWNLHGGEKRSQAVGEYEYLFGASFSVASQPLFSYEGGTFFTSFVSHHWKEPSQAVGSYVFVDTMEAAPFDELYSLWYKQAFAEGKYWLLIGKSDAYDNFTVVPHAVPFINSGYTTIPTIPFFPTYPDPAMSIVGFATLFRNMSVTLGVFDGSLAEGYHTGTHGVTGRFFNNLSKHAFLIGELDCNWNLKKNLEGRLGFIAWGDTAKLSTFSGRQRRGTWGPAVTLDQVIYKKDKEEGAFFAMYGSADSSLSDVNRYIALGMTWNGAFYQRDVDLFGIGMSRADFTSDPNAGYSKSYEASFEAFYKFQFSKFGFLEPDFQYIVHPGGKGLPNASVFTIRLQVNI